jgi:hypothetical protein
MHNPRVSLAATPVVTRGCRTDRLLPVRPGDRRSMPGRSEFKSSRLLYKVSGGSRALQPARHIAHVSRGAQPDSPFRSSQGCELFVRLDLSVRFRTPGVPSSDRIPQAYGHLGTVRASGWALPAEAAPARVIGSGEPQLGLGADRSLTARRAFRATRSQPRAYNHPARQAIGIPRSSGTAFVDCASAHSYSHSCERGGRVVESSLVSTARLRRPPQPAREAGTGETGRSPHRRSSSERRVSVSTDLAAVAVLGAGLFATGYLLRPVRKRRRR